MNVPGFKAAAAAAGLKYKGRPDMGLIVADELASAAGVFTKSNVAAAPVDWCRRALASGRARAVLVNAGQANACTGEQGDANAAVSARAVAFAVGCSEDEVLLASTGVIGMQLNMLALQEFVPKLSGALNENALDDVANAMMTTDTCSKTSTRTGAIDGKPFIVSGMAKGSGMIMPNMATMLSFILTDAAVEPGYLQAILSKVTKKTFNAVTVDGDTSTNDTVLLLAGGKAGNDPISGPESSGAEEFENAVFEVALELAKMIAFDGEGATKAVTVSVSGARDAADAKIAAMSVANSPLVKTALFGEDANWGRIMMALGKSGADFDQRAVNVSVDDKPLVSGGMDAGNEQAAAAVMKNKAFTLFISLGDGPGAFEAYSCDFSYDYVKINADYRS